MPETDALTIPDERDSPEAVVERLRDHNAELWRSLKKWADYAHRLEGQLDEQIADNDERGRPDYQAYLYSREWAVVRRIALAHADNRCQLCNSPVQLEVHHRDYTNLGRETLDDVTVLCRDCHATHHGTDA